MSQTVLKKDEIAEEILEIFSGSIEKNELLKLNKETLDVIHEGLSDLLKIDSTEDVTEEIKALTLELENSKKNIEALTLELENSKKERTVKNASQEILEEEKESQEIYAALYFSQNKKTGASTRRITFNGTEDRKVLDIEKFTENEIEILSSRFNSISKTFEKSEYVFQIKVNEMTREDFFKSLKEREENTNIEKQTVEKELLEMNHVEIKN